MVVNGALESALGAHVYQDKISIDERAFWLENARFF